MKLNKNIKLNFKLKLRSGLHIGAGSDQIKIGGIDNAVVSNPLTKMPYIPGSSIKGKMRYLLGCSKGVNDLNDVDISVVFGTSADVKFEQDCGPTRIRVRDLNMTKKWEEKFNDCLENGEFFTEEKAENIITRDECRSTPRFIERVPAGVEFDGQILLKIYDGDDEEKFKKMIEEALQLVEDDFLGGSGSRGYGEIEILDKEWV